jgi:phenylacetate-coenzyme A ligase PaaK-like adenylate-forming protein
MNIVQNFLNINPYSLKKKDKLKKYLNYINKLTVHHYKNCKIYGKIIKNLKFKIKKKNNLENFPMLPVRIFKKYSLQSVPKNKIIKKLVSSGTSGQELSKIYLDKKNAKNQTIVLKKITETILGNQRLPMLIVDRDPKVLDRSVFNAQLAAIYGFSIFGKHYCYLLDEKGNIDYKKLNEFLKKYSHDNFFIFGFTSLIYENLIKKLSTKLIYSNFQNGILLHGGGWKKLEKLKISNKNFRKKLFSKIKLKKIHNYYGLVEQTGSIFIESNECGYFHTSIYSNILIRNNNFEIVQKGTKGIIQLFSLLPTSYPGHNILTEDIGEIVGEDNCKCGKQGKYFLVHGRAKEAETRGCSDVK